MAALAWLIMGEQRYFWSALYGAGSVVLPGALMARGMTSQLSSMAPGVSAVSLALMVCMKVYWVALSWRGRKTTS